ncbi:YrrS family protein [Anoxybacillus sp.]|uniref:YrrS family protein n=1 Tax=Anoxybacillus sp. TaxID=1872573 RepID=UPI00262D0984|nr:YrrS family protein [uncultured Anoxybacillus sp.]
MSSRFAKRSKQRKVNRILNTFITIVFALILFFGWKWLFANDRPVKETNASPQPVEVEMSERETNEQQPSEQQTEQEENKEQVEETVVDDPNSNVIREIVNSTWQPIGTTQSEPHVTQYDKNSVDWKEMLDAISYATGISSSDLIVWFIGNGGSPNHAVATVSKKDKTEHYKVFIEWVTNEGWKPTKVQQLKEIERRP